MSLRARPLLFITLAIAPVGLLACTSDGGNNTVPVKPPGSGTGGSRPGNGGTPMTGSGSGGGPAATGGVAAGMTGGTSGGTGGASGEGGSGPTDVATETGTPTDVAPTETPPAQTGDWMGYPGVKDLTQVVPTEGCGKMPDIPAAMWRSFDIANIPTPVGQRDNAGDGTRRYFVRLPTGYMPDKKYKVLIAASSCTGGNQNLAAMGDVAPTTDATGGAILISPVVEPGVWDRDQCYDDKDPNSIEHPFLERFLAQVGQKYCYDKNKVFVQGHSSGGWYSNMIGCTHASELIRGMSSNGGGIPNDTTHRAKCNSKPMPGLWIHPVGDTEEPQATKRAISRALVINKCQGAGTNIADETAWEKAASAPWTVQGAVNCRKYMCPEAFPVIFCAPPGTHGPISWHSRAAWAMFNALP